VSPVIENVTSMKVHFPKNNDWVDWWNSSIVYKGGSKVTYNVPLDSFPVFKRVGSIIPMRVESDDSLHGTKKSSNYLTFLISHP